MIHESSFDIIGGFFLRLFCGKSNFAMFIVFKIHVMIETKKAFPFSS